MNLSGRSDVAKIRERFMEFVHPEPNTGCWLWAGWCKYGYGRFSLDGKVLRAHRAAYELFVAPIPDGLCVCHSCDVRPCVNPSHLWPGTNADNTRDKTEKGRAVGPKSLGEANGRSRLTRSDVLLIRGLRGEVTQKELAKRHGVAVSTISAVQRREIWPHVNARAPGANRDTRAVPTGVDTPKVADAPPAGNSVRNEGRYVVTVGSPGGVVAEYRYPSFDELLADVDRVASEHRGPYRALAFGNEDRADVDCDGLADDERERLAEAGL